MAEMIGTPPAEGKRGRGRPKGSGKAAAAAAAKANAMVAAVPKGAPPAPATTTPEDDYKGPPHVDAGKAPETASGFGHNRADESNFLRHVQTLRAKDVELIAAKEVVKALNGQRKDLRNKARSEGIVLRELDDALADLETDRVDLQEKEVRRRLYREWLGLPNGTQAELDLQGRTPDAAREAVKWFEVGNTDGRLAKIRQAPDYCPPDRVQDYLKGFDQGTTAFLEKSPLTRDAFKKPGARAEADPAPPAEDEPAATTAPAASALLILGRGDFQAEGVNYLEDCSRATLMPERLAVWDASERIVVIMNGARRELKYPADGDDAAYEDLGLPDGELTDPEPATPEEIAAVEGADPAPAADPNVDPPAPEFVSDVVARAAEAPADQAGTVLDDQEAAAAAEFE